MPVRDTVLLKAAATQSMGVEPQEPSLHFQGVAVPQGEGSVPGSQVYVSDTHLGQAALLNWQLPSGHMAGVDVGHVCAGAAAAADPVARRRPVATTILWLAYEFTQALKEAAQVRSGQRTSLLRQGHSGRHWLAVSTQLPSAHVTFCASGHFTTGGQLSA